MDESADMHSLLLTDNSTLLLGGLQNYVTEVDLNTVQETQKVRLPYTCTQYPVTAGEGKPEPVFQMTSRSANNEAVHGKSHSKNLLPHWPSMARVALPCIVGMLCSPEQNAYCLIILSKFGDKWRWFYMRKIGANCSNKISYDEACVICYLVSVLFLLYHL